MAPYAPTVIRRFFSRPLAGAAALQRRLAHQVIEADAPGELRVVAGADVAYDQLSGRLFAAVAVFDAESLALVQLSTWEGPATTPYVPGFLSFREGPAVITAISRIQPPPDLLLCDGHGRAHPRRFGLACHIGVALGVPTIGVGKSLLVGTHRNPGPRRGAAARLIDRGEVIGLALRTRDRVKPVFVSVGHRVSLETARRLVLRWSPRFRSPEPIRRAHHEVTRLRAAARDRAQER